MAAATVSYRKNAEGEWVVQRRPSRRRRAWLWLLFSGAAAVPVLALIH